MRALQIKDNEELDAVVTQQLFIIRCYMIAQGNNWADQAKLAACTKTPKLFN